MLIQMMKQHVRQDPLERLDLIISEDEGDHVLAEAVVLRRAQAGERAGRHVDHRQAEFRIERTHLRLQLAREPGDFGLLALGEALLLLAAGGFFGVE